MIEKELFIKIIDNTPLVSLDFIIVNKKNEILLGLRNNEPAKDFWFVPGGRILKNEKITAAFNRLLRVELNLIYDFKQAKHLGLYEHFYSTNACLVDKVSTHYVVNAFLLDMRSIDLNLVKDNQHRELKWFSFNELAMHKNVHENTKAYLAKLDFLSVAGQYD